MTETVLKIAGACAILIASVFYGQNKIREVRRGVLELSAFLEFVVFIGDNIEHFMKPLPDIVSEYRGEYLVGCAFMESASRYGLREAWSRFDTSVTGEAKSVLDNFFNTVGSGFADDEKRLAEYTAHRLSSILDGEKVLARDKEKIYRTVPPMLAASVVLIII